MSDDLLRYDLMVENALRGVVREALREIEDKGALPGEHHFYISFLTEFPGVSIPTHLKQKYPHEMTIVLQYQFWGLDVGTDAFAVTLSFNDVQERVTVPFAAITSFADPAVQFGLQFQTAEDDEIHADLADLLDDAEDDDDPLPPKPTDKKTKSKSKSKSKDKKKDGPKVVELDAFRKKD